MKIGFRTLKTALGVSISILIAQLLHLDNYTAAGILTLLCIQRSRKQSAKAVSSRLIACMMSLFLSSALFELIGYHPYAFLVLMLIFIPLCVRLNVKEGIASSSVIVMHVYISCQTAGLFFLHEIFVIMIGLGVALLVNWYMPSIDKDLKQMKDTIDSKLATYWRKLRRISSKGLHHGMAKRYWSLETRFKRQVSSSCSRLRI